MRPPTDQGPSDLSSSTRPSELTVQSRIVDGIPVVSATGELDLGTLSRLEDALVAAEEEPSAAVVLDLTNLSFIDSSGLRVLIQSAGRLHELDKDLHVACGPGPVRRIIELTTVASRLAMHGELSAAVAASGA